jgi:hypothetical protein
MSNEFAQTCHPGNPQVVIPQLAQEPWVEGCFRECAALSTQPGILFWVQAVNAWQALGNDDVAFLFDDACAVPFLRLCFLRWLYQVGRIAS